MEQPLSKILDGNREAPGRRPRPMKIAFIVSMKEGLTQFIFRDIDALIRKGHELRVFSLLNRKGLFNPLPHWDVTAASPVGLMVHNALFLALHPVLYSNLLWTALRTGSFRDLAIAVGFVRRMREVEIMYAYFGDHKLYTGYYCKRITGVPLVVSIRAYELYHNPNPRMFDKALAYCDRVVTITQHNRDLLVAKHGVPADKIDIVRQILDLDKFKFVRKVKVLIVGFFAEKKGHEVLFKAFKRMDRSDVELWVVGDGNRSVVNVDCRQLAKEQGIDSQVAFFGMQRDTALRALYRECDVFCLPSRPDRFGDHEGFPNVIAEAMAFGKPVVTTRHAGIPEAIESILVDENSVEQLADALNRACDSAEMRQQLGAANRVNAERMFSPRNNDLLEDVLRESARRVKPAASEDNERDHERRGSRPPRAPLIERALPEMRNVNNSNSR